MNILGAVFIVVMAFVTATLSGVFGMAGGLVLMGALALVLPVSAAFVTHGILQLFANGWRAVLHARHVRWDIVGWYAAASLLAGVLARLNDFLHHFGQGEEFATIQVCLLDPDRATVTIVSAGHPPPLRVEAAHASLNLLAGVAGPLLDVFFVRTVLTRHAIVATKAATQVFAHLAKIVVYGAPLLTTPSKDMPDWRIFAVAIPLSMCGTWVGGKILDRMTDVDFKSWTKWIVTGVGVVYLIQAAQLFMRGGG